MNVSAGEERVDIVHPWRDIISPHEGAVSCVVDSQEGAHLWLDRVPQEVHVHDVRQEVGNSSKKPQGNADVSQIVFRRIRLAVMRVVFLG